MTPFFFYSITNLQHFYVHTANVDVCVAKVDVYNANVDVYAAQVGSDDGTIVVIPEGETVRPMVVSDATENVNVG